VTTISGRGKGKPRPPSLYSASNLHDVIFLATLASIKATPAHPTFHTSIESSKDHHLSVTVLSPARCSSPFLQHPNPVIAHRLSLLLHGYNHRNSIDEVSTHAVIVPYPCSSNANHVLHLDKLMHQQGVYITFVNTEHTITPMDAK
jgi:hypothetical protein